MASEMFVGWTTVGTAEAAELLANGAVEAGLAACVQIDSPVTSIYRWKGRTERSPEIRLTLKFLADRSAALEAWIHAHHPYEVPEWVVVPADRVSEKYLSWARSLPTD